MTKEEVIKQFSSLKGIGKAKAELLYSHGYESIEKLQKASVDDLTKIDGISEKIAQDILTQLKNDGKKPTPVRTETKKETKQKPKKEEPAKKTEKKEKKTQKSEDVEIVEEDEQRYKPKIKPALSQTQQHQLKIRKQIKKRTPEFLREEWFRYKRIPKNWRVPDGYTSKMRRHKKYRPPVVSIGYRGPQKVRGLHPSGFIEVVVHNIQDLDTIDPKTQAARIGASVGTKKRMEIAKKAEEKNIRVLNNKG